MTVEELRELRALLEEATEGPWWLQPSSNDPRHTLVVAGVDTRPAICDDSADAALIVALRNHAEALLDVAEAAARTAEFRRHEEGGGRECLLCGDDWPCPTRQALDRLEAAE